MSPPFTLSCLCGTIKEDVRERIYEPYAWDVRETQNGTREVDSCRYISYRHATGVLCTSYFPSLEPTQESLENMTAYPPLPYQATFTKDTRRYFCSTCGSHLFRSAVDRDRAEMHDDCVSSNGKFMYTCGCKDCREAVSASKKKCTPWTAFYFEQKQNPGLTVQ
jgi:hypothetical protein